MTGSTAFVFSHVVFHMRLVLKSGIYERLILLYKLIKELLSPFYYENQVDELNEADIGKFSYILTKIVV